MKTINIYVILIIIIFSFTKSSYTQNLPVRLDCYGNVENPNVVEYDCESPYLLIFDDNFGGNSLDTINWIAVTGVPRDCPHDNQKAWHRPENVVLENGKLKIITRKETIYGESESNKGCSSYTYFSEDFEYTSGEIWTNKKFTYGKFEAKVKIPKGKGFFPAFWLFAGNPVYNEIDIFEFWNEPKGDSVNYNPNLLSRVHNMTVHYDYGSGREECKAKYTSSDFSQNFHVFSLIWEPDKIIWLVDGEEVGEMYRYYNLLNNEVVCPYPWDWLFKREREFFPKDPMYLILNLAIQSGYNLPDPNTVFPNAMEVEWVRVYQRRPCIDIAIFDPDYEIKDDEYNAVVGNRVIIVGSSDSIPYFPINEYVIEESQHLHVTANESIILYPGFTAKEGSVFSAKINPNLCANTMFMLDSDSLSIQALDNALANIEPADSLTEVYDYSDSIEDINDEYNNNELIELTDCEYEFSDINIYPNPTDGFITIDLGYNNCREINIQLFDMNSKILYSANAPSQIFQLNLTKIPKGIYNIVLSNSVSGYSVAQKIIIE
jgi:beta-glucanase (GH16 family)